MSTERLLAEYVPWQDYVGQDMVLLNDGTVFMMLAVDGLPFETSDDAVISHRHDQLESALRDGARTGLRTSL